MENRDESHEEQMERWARFVKENPRKWKKIETVFGFANFNCQKIL
jgi:hypothetical protein